MNSVFITKCSALVLASVTTATGFAMHSQTRQDTAKRYPYLQKYDVIINKPLAQSYDSNDIIVWDEEHMQKYGSHAKEILQSANMIVITGRIYNDDMYKYCGIKTGVLTKGRADERAFTAVRADKSHKNYSFADFNSGVESRNGHMADYTLADISSSSSEYRIGLKKALNSYLKLAEITNPYLGDENGKTTMQSVEDGLSAYMHTAKKIEIGSTEYLDFLADQLYNSSDDTFADTQDYDIFCQYAKEYLSWSENQDMTYGKILKLDETEASKTLVRKSKGIY